MPVSLKERYRKRYAASVSTEEKRAKKRAYERAYRSGPYKGKGYKKSGWALHLRTAYGLTIEEHEKLRSDQNFCCKICGSEEWEQPKGKLFVDHSHKTNEVRGLLCDNCNRGLGMFRDDPLRLELAAKYLRSTCHS